MSLSGERLSPTASGNRTCRRRRASVCSLSGGELALAPLLLLPVPRRRLLCATPEAAATSVVASLELASPSFVSPAPPLLSISGRSPLVAFAGSSSLAAKVASHLARLDAARLDGRASSSSSDGGSRNWRRRMRNFQAGIMLQPAESAVDGDVNQSESRRESSFLASALPRRCRWLPPPSPASLHLS